MRDARDRCRARARLHGACLNFCTQGQKLAIETYQHMMEFIGFRLITLLGDIHVKKSSTSSVEGRGGQQEEAKVTMCSMNNYWQG